MTTQQFLKGLISALVAVVVAYLSQTPIDYLLMAIAGVSAILVYSGKNLIALLHSDSVPGVLSWINVVSVLLILLGNAVIDSVATYYISGVIQWVVVGKLTASVVLTYVVSTWFAPPHNSTTNKKLFKLAA